VSETNEEMLARVEMMAAGNPTWDLSDNDRRALIYVLGLAHPALDAAPVEPDRPGFDPVEDWQKDPFVRPMAPAAEGSEEPERCAKCGGPGGFVEVNGTRVRACCAFSFSDPAAPGPAPRGAP